MTIAQQLGVKKYPFEIKDNKGNKIYYEYSNIDWGKWEYDDKGKVIYFEDNTGRIIDSRLKPVSEYTMEELIDKLRHGFKIKK